MQKNKQFSVYWFDPEPVVGSELRKVRPCIVVSPEEINKVVRTVIIVPLTSTSKSWPFRTHIMINGKISSAACDQARAIDKSRLKSFISDLPPNDAKAVLQTIQQIFA